MIVCNALGVIQFVWRILFPITSRSNTSQDCVLYIQYTVGVCGGFLLVMFFSGII
jgi:hypothetical protein